MLDAAEAVAEARGSREAAAFAEVLAEAKARPRAAIHAFHRWFGKLIPALPAAAIEAYTRPGDLVVDPFCGSGTVLVEARLAGRRSLGSDVNPLAVLLSRVKTRCLDPATLEAAAVRVLTRFADEPLPDWRDSLPAVPNREHYYPDPVARDLVRLLRAARDETDPDVREHFTALVSAINRDVSNADTRHVFPGVSKRMRSLIAGGWIGDVPARFARALRDRLQACRNFHEAARGGPTPVVAETPAAALPADPGTASLVVTNPPYVSSIRYVETFKLEAYWLGTCRDSTDLARLDSSTLGTERLGPPRPLGDDELDALPASVRPAVEDLRRRDEHAAARVVATYARGLAPCAAAMAAALEPGGRALIKLAPSRLRGAAVPTPQLMAELLAGHGVDLVGSIDDAYATHSRSLTTARNWYSGRMDADLLLLFRRRTAA